VSPTSTTRSRPVAVWAGRRLAAPGRGGRRPQARGDSLACRSVGTILASVRDAGSGEAGELLCGTHDGSRHLVTVVEVVPMTPLEAPSGRHRDAQAAVPGRRPGGQWCCWTSRCGLLPEGCCSPHLAGRTVRRGTERGRKGVANSGCIQNGSAVQRDHRQPSRVS
jgi:hypothetical protein